MANIKRHIGHYLAAALIGVAAGAVTYTLLKRRSDENEFDDYDFDLDDLEDGDENGNQKEATSGSQTASADHESQEPGEDVESWENVSVQDTPPVYEEKFTGEGTPLPS